MLYKTIVVDDEEVELAFEHIDFKCTDMMPIASTRLIQLIVELMKQVIPLLL
jgi:hypothetical protein